MRTATLLTIIALAVATPGVAEPTLLARLVVPGHKVTAGERLAYREDCSATLVSPGLLLSAWHCLEHYRDLSQDIRATVNGRPRTIARPRSDGGGMTADWALLALDMATPGSRPYPAISNALPPVGSTVEMLGFPRGKTDLWQGRCRVLESGRARIVTDCAAVKGTSGGPVYHEDTLVGVISAGDGNRVTIVTPSTLFSREVRRLSR